MSAQPRSILIIGAGLAGSLLAKLLADDGHTVHVYERRPDPREKGYVGGRSINLALSARGIHGLRAAGVLERVMQDAIPMRGRMMHAPTGELTFQRYSSDPADAINSVSRGALNKTLIEAADEHDRVRFHFDRRCVDVDLEKPAAVFENPHTAFRETAEADVILGADGAFSALRAKLQIQDRFDYTQDYLAHGYKELHIPEGESGAFRMEKNALHIWPRGGSMMIALPNPDGSFTCTLFWPYEGPHGFGAIRSAADIEPFFRRHYPDAVPLMHTLVEDYTRNPVGSLVTVRCFPWAWKGKALLLGDAAHAIVPFYGQGMNCAFEDCVALRDLLREHKGDTARAFDAFQRLRKPHADAIADMAVENFVEMRDKVASPAFLWRKKLEHLLHKLLPALFLPRYNMISFSLIPYAEARARAKRQNAALSAALVVIAALVVFGVAAIVWRVVR